MYNITTQFKVHIYMMFSIPTKIYVNSYSLDKAKMFIYGC